MGGFSLSWTVSCEPSPYFEPRSARAFSEPSAVWSTMRTSPVVYYRMLAIDSWYSTPGVRWYRRFCRKPIARSTRRSALHRPVPRSVWYGALHDLYYQANPNVIRITGTTTTGNRARRAREVAAQRAARIVIRVAPD